MKPIPFEQLNSVFQNIRSGVADELFKLVVDNPKHQRAVLLKIVEVLGKDTVGNSLRKCFLSDQSHRDAFISLYRNMISSITPYDMFSAHMDFERKYGILKDYNQECFEDLKKKIKERRQSLLAPQKSVIRKMIASSNRQSGKHSKQGDHEKLPTKRENTLDVRDPFKTSFSLKQLKKNAEENLTDEEKAFRKLRKKLSTREILYNAKVKKIYLSDTSRLRNDAIVFLKQGDAGFLTNLYLGYLNGSNSTEDLPPNLIRRVVFVNSKETSDIIVNALNKKPAKPKKVKEKPREPLKKLKPGEKMQLILVVGANDMLWRYRATKNMTVAKELKLSEKNRTFLKLLFDETKVNRITQEFADQSNFFQTYNRETTIQSSKLREAIKNSTGYYIPTKESIKWETREKVFKYNRIEFKLESENTNIDPSRTGYKSDVSGFARGDNDVSEDDTENDDY
jgi:hypothetical protein